MASNRMTGVLLAAVPAVSACGKKPAEPAASNAAIDRSLPAAAETARLPRTQAPDGARVFFTSPADGDTVSSPVRIAFGIKGMTVTRAGDYQPNSGHHHLIIDADLPDLAAPIPASPNYVHFGDGRTETELTLEPGQHTPPMLLGDHHHVPHDPPVMSDPISITVE